jgi:cell division protease FtsH
MSDETLDRADRAVRRMVADALDGALALLGRHRAELDGLADLLMVEETVDEEQITALLGVPPVPDAAVHAPVAALEAVDGK